MIVPTHTGSIARMFPAFDELRDPSTQDEVPPDAREVRRRAATTLREVLRRIAVARPTVVLLDDLQWTDRDSASFLAQVLSPPDSPPLLFIGAACTNENGDDPELVSVLSALLQTVPERLGLVPLAEGPSSLLAKAALSAHGVDSAPLAEAIARASRGVPLVILEMAFDCSQPERIADDADAWLSRARGRRLAGLDAMSGEALELLALADRPISEAVLDQALTEPSREDVPAWSRTLRGARLARRCRGGRIELLPIARDVALARIMPSVRAERHRRLALAYEHSADGEAAATTRASRSRAACSRTWASRSRAAASARSSSC